MSETEPSTRKFSFFFLAIVFITIALAIAAFFQAYDAYGATPPRVSDGTFFMLIGFSALALSTYMIFQTRRRVLKLAFKPPRIATIIMCQKCGFKNIRDFQRGDFIFQETEECPKCKEKMMITSIFREVKEKEKRRS